MTVTASDLKLPTGELQPAWFPDGDLDTNIAYWIAAVDLGSIAAGEDQDRATTAYVYSRAYRTVAGRLANAPTTRKTNELTTTIDAARVKFFTDMADRWETVYQAILAEAPIVQTEPASSAAQIIPTW